MDAVTVHVPVPGPLTGRFKLPFKATESLYERTPVQTTLADVALLVFHAKFGTLPVAVDTAGLKIKPLTVGARTTSMLKEPVAFPPVPTAVTVQEPWPIVAPAVNVRLPPVAVPVPDPLTAPLQLAEDDVALLTLHVNVDVPPTATLAGLNVLVPIVGTPEAATVRSAEPIAVAPPEPTAETVQVAVPALVVLTVIVPLVPDPVAVAPAPEQLTVAEAALAVAQLKLLLLPALTLVGLKLAEVTPTLPAGVIARSALPLTIAPLAPVAITVQLAAVVATVVPTVMLPAVPVAVPVTVTPVPAQLTLADVALVVLQLKLLLVPATTVAGLKLAALTPSPLGAVTVKGTVVLVVVAPALDTVK